MCTENKQDALAGVKSSLRYIEEDVQSALHHAENVGDKTLTQKLTAIKTSTQGVKDYIAERTNSKTG